VITRSVLVEEVEVVFLPENPTSPDPTRGKWFVGPAERVRWIDELNRTGHSQVRGIVYVRENARVLMLVELGMTAAESAEYYPPITRERTDAHYDLHAASGQPVKRSAIGPLDCTDPMRDCTYRVRDCTSI
jgi:hypothetical protein